MVLYDCCRLQKGAPLRFGLCAQVETSPVQFKTNLLKGSDVEPAAARMQLPSGFGLPGWKVSQISNTVYKADYLVNTIYRLTIVDLSDKPELVRTWKRELLKNVSLKYSLFSIYKHLKSVRNAIRKSQARSNGLGHFQQPLILSKCETQVFRSANSQRWSNGSSGGRKMNGQRSKALRGFIRT